ncbi:titin homolog isoform X2 [Periplaneta americana]|uniref:titin homolog isoform X2 n=1 Tax=Periplaneta americana TaxID=6978 RepID=UPI0037E95305
MAEISSAHKRASDTEEDDEVHTSKKIASQGTNLPNHIHQSASSNFLLQEREESKDAVKLEYNSIQDHRAVRNLVISCIEASSYRPRLSISPLTITTNVPPPSRYATSLPNDCLNPSIKCMIVPPLSETNYQKINSSAITCPKEKTSVSDPNIRDSFSSLVIAPSHNFRNISKVKEHARESLTKKRQTVYVRKVLSLETVRNISKIYYSKFLSDTNISENSPTKSINKQATKTSKIPIKTAQNEDFLHQQTKSMRNDSVEETRNDCSQVLFSKLPKVNEEGSANTCVKLASLKLSSETLPRPVSSASMYNQRTPAFLASDQPHARVQSWINTTVPKITEKPVTRPMSAVNVDNKDKQIRSKKENPFNKFKSIKKKISSKSAEKICSKGTSKDLYRQTRLSQMKTSTNISEKKSVKATSKNITKQISPVSVYKQNRPAVSLKDSSPVPKLQTIKREMSKKNPEKFPLRKSAYVSSRPISSASICKHNISKSRLMTKTRPIGKDSASSSVLSVYRKKQSINLSSDKDKQQQQKENYTPMVKANCECEFAMPQMIRVDTVTSRSRPVLKNLTNENNNLHNQNRKDTTNSSLQATTMKNMLPKLKEVPSHPQEEVPMQCECEDIHEQEHDLQDSKMEVISDSDEDMNEILLKFSNLSIYDDAEEKSQWNLPSPDTTFSFKESSQVGDSGRNYFNIGNLTSLVEYKGSSLRERKAKTWALSSAAHSLDLRRRLESISEFRKHLLEILYEIEEEKHRLETSREFCISEIIHFKQYFNRYFYVPMWQL